jgi:hypothetical protein
MAGDRRRVEGQGYAIGDDASTYCPVRIVDRAGMQTVFWL